MYSSWPTLRQVSELQIELYSKPSLETKAQIHRLLTAREVQQVVNCQSAEQLELLFNRFHLESCLDID